MFDSARRNWLTRNTNAISYQRLPWLMSEAQFIDDCTRCGRCVDACKPAIIVNADGGYPKVDFNSGECTFCGDCRQACPEPLFNQQASAKPWGNVAQINAQCLTAAQVECRSCGDHCQPQAIRFRLISGAVAQPQLSTQDCTGCGACISICPTGAISITAMTEDQ